MTNLRLAGAAGDVVVLMTVAGISQAMNQALAGFVAVALLAALVIMKPRSTS